MSARTTPLSVTVIEAVAAAHGVDPLDLPSPLTDAVDPDALDSLFRTSTGGVTFEYCGYLVTAHADRTVDVTPMTDA